VNHASPSGAVESRQAEKRSTVARLSKKLLVCDLTSSSVVPGGPPHV
jgi:hypothetical protein